MGTLFPQGATGATGGTADTLDYGSLK